MAAFTVLIGQVDKPSPGTSDHSGMLVMLVVIALFFWVAVLVDCLGNEPSQGNDKIAWVLVILFLPVLGAILYVAVRRPHRPKT